MAVNGKSKGNNFERTVSNKLSNVFESILNIKQGFRRNPDSGSFFGGKNHKRIDDYSKEHQHFGDIITPDNFIFSIECKSYKTPPSYNAILRQDCTQWDKWLEQAETDANNSNKQPLLIVKYNNIEPFVFTYNDNIDVLFYYKKYKITTFDNFFKESNLLNYLDKGLIK